MRTKLLIISPSKKLPRTIERLLDSYAPDMYEIVSRESLDQEFPIVNVAIVDEDSIDRDPEVHLARVSFEVYPIPLIYLVDGIQSERAFKSIRSLTTDYLLKNHLSGAVLHNSLKYAVESTRLRLELEKQQNRYKTLFYNSIDPSFFLADDWTFENVNSAFSSLFEIDFNRTKGQSFRILFNDEKDFEELLKSDDLRERNQVETEVRFRLPGRNKKFLGHLKISTLREFDVENERKITVGYHGTLSNISYRERIRKIKARAERVGMTFRLARALAHEIRNPLTNINLALTQIRDDTPVGEEGEVYLGIIERSTNRIDRLIGQLLSSSNRKPITRKLCRIEDLIEKVAEEARDRSHLKKIKISVDIEEGLPGLSCDMEKLHIALSNTVTNAIEAISGENGQVTIGAYREEGDICLYVEDTGEGMTDETKERLFDPFYTGKTKGLGLGLTATQTIVAEHEGQIEVESALGVGSTITLCLPCENL